MMYSLPNGKDEITSCSRHKGSSVSLIKNGRAEQLYFCDDKVEPHFVLANVGKILDDTIYLIYGTTAQYYLERGQMLREEIKHY